MAKKTFTFVASILAIMFCLSLASALSITSYPSKISQESGSFNVTVNSNKTLSMNVTSNLEDVTFGSITYLVEGNDTIVNIPYDTNDFNFNMFDDYSVTVGVKDQEGNSTSQTIPFEKATYCKSYENKGKLDLEIDDVRVTNGFGDEDDFWYLRDTIEVKVNVINDGSWDVEDIEIEWALYTEDGKLIMDDTEDKIDLDSDDDTSVTFTFKLDENMDDFEDSNAILYVRAVGQIKDKDADEYDGDDTCAWIDSSTDVSIDKNFVIVDDLEVNGQEVEDIYSETLGCSQEVTISGKLWNIGYNDQDDVYMEIYSSALGVYDKVEVSSLDAYDDESFSYTFKIPAEIDEKKYKISFEVFDEDKDLYENDEDDTSTKIIQLNVAGNCKVYLPTIGASLVSEEVKGGQEMVIKATVINTGDSAQVYTISSEGFESFAKLVSIDAPTISIPAGASKDVTLTYLLNKDAQGAKSFNLQVMDSKNAVTQPVSVNVEKGTFSLNDIFTKGNLTFAGIILLNLILIIAIVLVARRIIKKR